MEHIKRAQQFLRRYGANLVFYHIWISFKQEANLFLPLQMLL